jgi:molybdopterin molybdotransferase
MQTGELVAVSGGSSRGEKDTTLKVFEAAASPGVFMHGLAMKPGKPTILAFDEASGTLLVGLPGHPVAALMVFERIILEAWQRRIGSIGRLQITAELSGNLPGAPGRESCVPVKLVRKKDGATVATAVFGESGLITTLTESDGYIVIERNTEGLKSGETVIVHLF